MHEVLCLKGNPRPSIACGVHKIQVGSTDIWVLWRLQQHGSSVSVICNAVEDKFHQRICNDDWVVASFQLDTSCLTLPGVISMLSVVLARGKSVVFLILVTTKGQTASNWIQIRSVFAAMLHKLWIWNSEKSNWQCTYWWTPVQRTRTDISQPSVTNSLHLGLYRFVGSANYTNVFVSDWTRQTTIYSTHSDIAAVWHDKASLQGVCIFLESYTNLAECTFCAFRKSTPHAACVVIQQAWDVGQSIRQADLWHFSLGTMWPTCLLTLAVRGFHVCSGQHLLSGLRHIKILTACDIVWYFAHHISRTRSQQGLWHALT